MQTTQTSRTLSADWTQVLARVETALAKAVTQLSMREQALAASLLPQSAPSLDFAKFEERLAGLAECQQPTEQRLQQLDSALGEGEETLRDWLGRAEATRKQLAAWVGRAVG